MCAPPPMHAPCLLLKGLPNQGGEASEQVRGAGRHQGELQGHRLCAKRRKSPDRTGGWTAPVPLSSSLCLCLCPSVQTTSATLQAPVAHPRPFLPRLTKSRPPRPPGDLQERPHRVRDVHVQVPCRQGPHLGDGPGEVQEGGGRASRHPSVFLTGGERCTPPPCSSRSLLTVIKLRLTPIPPFAFPHPSLNLLPA